MLLHRQLHRAIRDGVLGGRLAPGTRLPSTRTLAGELRLSRTVVVRAYERLRAEGVLESRVGSGTWVREGAAERGGGRAPTRRLAPRHPASAEPAVDRVRVPRGVRGATHRAGHLPRPRPRGTLLPRAHRDRDRLAAGARPDRTRPPRPRRHRGARGAALPGRSPGLRGRRGPAVQALDDEGRVIYAGTFSKVLFPSLRLGYLVLPESLVEPFRTAKWLVDRHSPTLEQDALAHFISEGSYDRHLRRMRRVHGRRRAALLEALDAELGGRVRVVGANAGVHVLAWLEGVDPVRLPEVVAAARRREVGVYPVTPYHAGEPPGPGLLLGYAILDEEQIREGVRRLRAALDEVGGRARRAAGPRRRPTGRGPVS